MIPNMINEFSIHICSLNCKHNNYDYNFFRNLDIEILFQQELVQNKMKSIRQLGKVNVVNQKKKIS